MRLEEIINSFPLRKANNLVKKGLSAALVLSLLSSPFHKSYSQVIAPVPTYIYQPTPIMPTASPPIIIMPNIDDPTIYGDQQSGSHNSLSEPDGSKINQETVLRPFVINNNSEQQEPKEIKIIGSEEIQFYFDLLTNKMDSSLFASDPLDLINKLKILIDLARVDLPSAGLSVARTILYENSLRNSPLMPFEQCTYENKGQEQIEEQRVSTAFFRYSPQNKEENTVEQIKNPSTKLETELSAEIRDYQEYSPEIRDEIIRRYVEAVRAIERRDYWNNNYFERRGDEGDLPRDYIPPDMIREIVRDNYKAEPKGRLNLDFNRLIRRGK
jgi:hypothetical protein